LVLPGLAGIVLPALPGGARGHCGGTWIDDFTRVGWFATATVTVLAVLA
jgi:uncharacterized protein